jgi:hypothetical protein
MLSTYKAVALGSAGESVGNDHRLNKLAIYGKVLPQLFGGGLQVHTRQKTSHNIVPATRGYATWQNHSTMQCVHLQLKPEGCGKS